MTSESKNAGLGMTYQEPEPLVEPEHNLRNIEGNHAYSLDNVPEDDKVYKEIGIDFENADITICKVEKLTNLHLEKRYVTERNLILEQRKHSDPDFKLNEKYLYHGTSVLKSSICEEGLDSRMSKEGCFGKGIYFSDYPKKCVKYAEKGGNTESFILLVRVILGESKEYPRGKKDKTLVREPEKLPPYTGYRFYDSVQGCPVNHKEFVVYESRRALVEGIITYKKPEPKSVPKASKATSSESGGVQSSSDTDSDSSKSDDEQHGDDHDAESITSSDGEDDLLQDSLDVNNKQGQKSKDSSTEAMITRKKKEFMEATDVKDEYVVDHCLLKADLDVKKAVKVYQEMPKDVELKYQDMSEEEAHLEIDTGSDEERAAARTREPPLPNSTEWAKMSEDDKEAIIKGLVEDFLHVTGLTEDEEPYARTCLSKTNNQLDFAILAYYEDMTSASGDV